MTEWGGLGDQELDLLDSCCVSDALDAHGLKGVVEALAPTWPGGPIRGLARTLRLRAPSRDAHADEHLGIASIRMARPGDVIVVDNQGRRDSAAWGGLLSLSAELAGVRGCIVYGLCRDIDEAEELGFPVHALGSTPVTARGRTVTDAVDVDLMIAGVTVRPGDLVFADGSGVAFVPAAHAEAVLATALDLAQRERAIAARLREGDSPEQALAGYEQMLLSRAEED